MAQLASLEAMIPSLEAVELISAHRLSVLLGEQPETLLAELRAPAPPLKDPDEIGVGVPSELLKRRPDIRRTEMEIQAAFARVGVAKADLYPKFVISGLSGRQTTEFSGFTLGAGNFFSVGPGISLPIFTAGKVRSNIAVQKARLEQAVIQYRQDVLTAAEETENAMASYRAQHERHQKLTAALEASRRAVDLSQELYTRGLADFLSVLEAQRQQYAAEDELTRCDTQLVTQAVALYKALGGGWERQ
jgi:NodT family efflux transporter outer membrane factor (OMF) lipoprotein